MNYKDFLDILISPHNGQPLFYKNGHLESSSSKKYQIINDIPILVKHRQKMHTIPPGSSKTSQNIPEYKVQRKYKNSNRILHLGSGNVKCRDKRVISLDVLPCENVDIVAEAENLPFADNSLDLVVSCAVFEHLNNPLTAIKEVKRVLKPGGILHIDNSYLQPYHGFPNNYFLMTPQANETYLVDDFILLNSEVPESGTPLMALTIMLDRFLSNLSKNKKEMVMSMSIKEFIDLAKSDLTSKNDLMDSFSEYEKRSLAATHAVIAQKPNNYEERLKKNKKSGSL